MWRHRPLRHILVTSKLLRYHQPGHVIFVTSVTRGRTPLLIAHADLLMESFLRYLPAPSVDLMAHVVMPDHFHAVIDPGNSDVSVLMQKVKISFAALYRKRLGRPCGGVWQRRFWDHIIRDEEDLRRHIDYVHYNPVKHGLTADPFRWPHSSLGRWFLQKCYQRDWGVRESLEFEGDFGE